MLHLDTIRRESGNMKEKKINEKQIHKLPKTELNVKSKYEKFSRTISRIQSIQNLIHNMIKMKIIMSTIVKQIASPKRKFYV